MIRYRISRYGFLSFEAFNLNLVLQFSICYKTFPMQESKKAFERYLSVERNASRYTIENYIRDITQLECFLKDEKLCLNNKEVDIYQTDKNAIKLFLGYLHKDHKKSSIARKLASIKAFFRFLVKKRGSLKNPDEIISSPLPNDSYATIHPKS